MTALVYVLIVAIMQTCTIAATIHAHAPAIRYAGIIAAIAQWQKLTIWGRSHGLVGKRAVPKPLLESLKMNVSLYSLASRGAPFSGRLPKHLLECPKGCALLFLISNRGTPFPSSSQKTCYSNAQRLTLIFWVQQEPPVFGAAAKKHAKICQKECFVQFLPLARAPLFVAAPKTLAKMFQKWWFVQFFTSNGGPPFFGATPEIHARMIQKDGFAQPFNSTRRPLFSGRLLKYLLLCSEKAVSFGCVVQFLSSAKGTPRLGRHVICMYDNYGICVYEYMRVL